MPVTRGPSFDARPPDCAFPTRLSDNRPQPLVTQHLEPIPSSPCLFSLHWALAAPLSLHRFPRFRLSPELWPSSPTLLFPCTATYEGNSVGRLFSISESERAITEDEAPFRFPYVAHFFFLFFFFFSILFSPPSFLGKTPFVQRSAVHVCLISFQSFRTILLRHLRPSLSFFCVAPPTSIRPFKHFFSLGSRSCCLLCLFKEKCSFVLCCVCSQQPAARFPEAACSRWPTAGI